MNASTLGLGGAALIAMTSALVVACSSKSTESGTPAQSKAAAVAGPTDSHCGGKPVVVASQASCHVAETPDAGEEDDAGNVDGGAEPKDEFGETNFNSEAEDDDCKYHVKWTSSAVAKDSDITFEIVATNRNDSSAVAGAKPYAEVFLNDTHPAPNTDVVTTETSPGTYRMGPIRFDAAGQWNVRFHFFADCADSPESPHGHVAFFVNVP